MLRISALAFYLLKDYVPTYGLIKRLRGRGVEIVHKHGPHAFECRLKCSKDCQVVADCFDGLASNLRKQMGHAEICFPSASFASTFVVRGF